MLRYLWNKQFNIYEGIQCRDTYIPYFGIDQLAYYVDFIDIHKHKRRTLARKPDQHKIGPISQQSSTHIASPFVY